MFLKIQKLIFILALSSSSWAQNATQNQDNQLNTPETRIVILPFFKKEIDNEFVAAFNQAGYKVVDTAQISHNLITHEIFNESARKIIELASKKGASKRKENMYSGFKENEIEDFKINTLRSDIIVIHTRIKSGTLTKMKKMGSFTLQGDILAYNLNTGEFILQCSKTAKIPFTNETTDRTIAIKQLVGGLFACYSSLVK